MIGELAQCARRLVMAGLIAAVRGMRVAQIGQLKSHSAATVAFPLPIGPDLPPLLARRAELPREATLPQGLLASALLIRSAPTPFPLEIARRDCPCWATRGELPAERRRYVITAVQACQGTEGLV